MVLMALVRTLVTWVLLAIRDALMPGFHLAWIVELGLSLVVAAADLAIIDLPETTFPAGGRAVQAGVATFAVMLISLHHLGMLWPAHTVVMSALMLAAGSGAAEWLVAARTAIPSP